MIYKLFLYPFIRTRKANHNNFSNILIYDIRKLIVKFILNKLMSNVVVASYNLSLASSSYILYSPSFIDQEQNIGFNQKIILSFLLKITTLENKSFYINYIIGELPKLSFNNTFLINGIEKIFVTKLTTSKKGVFFSKHLKGDVVYAMCRYVISEDVTLYIAFSKKGAYVIYNNKQLDLLSVLILLGASLSIFCKYFSLSNFSLNNKSPHYSHVFDLCKYDKKTRSLILELLRVIYLNRLSLERNELSLEQTLNSFSLELISIYEILHSISANKTNLLDIDMLSNKSILGAKNYFLHHVKLHLIRNSTHICKDITHFLSSISPNNESCNYLKVKSTNYFSLKNHLTVIPHIQCLDKINNLSELMHGNKISSYNPASHGNIQIRNVRLNNFGFICPIDTTEGINCGITLSLSQNTRIIDTNNLEVPLLPLKLEKSTLNHTFISHPTIEKLTILFNRYTFRKNKCFTLGEPSLVKNSLKLNETVKNREIFFMDYRNVLSHSENLVPFLFYNDPSRVLMGARMQTQSLPVLKKIRYFLSTEEGKNIMCLSPYTLTSKQEGIIVYVSNNKIILRDINNRKHIYYLRKFRVNDYSIINQVPIVWPGERVFLGQFLVSAQDSIGSEFNTGTNVKVVYGNFFGYNFEDSVVVNKRVVYTNLFTSIRLNIYETIFKRTVGGDATELPVNNCMYNGVIYKKGVDKYGIGKEGVKVGEGDVLISKFVVYNSFIENSDMAFASMLFGDYIRFVKDKSVTTTKGEEGRIIKTEVLSSGESNTYLKVRVYVMAHKLLKIGDKLCGFYGNKGIISYILSSKDIIYVNNGDSPDLITDAIGVPSRMNLGQLLENLLGKSCLYNNTRISIFNTGLISKGYLKHIIYNSLRNASYLTGKKELYNSYLPGNLLVRDGLTGYILKEPSFLGVVRYFKLVHTVADKIHYRTVGSYTEVIQQPVKGRDNIGGQRFGEMEIWALQAYGNSYAIREFLTYKSDDITARQSLLSYYDHKKHFGKITISEAFNTLLNEINGISLVLDVFASSKSISKTEMNINKFVSY